MTLKVVILPDAEDDIYRNPSWWAQHHSTGQASKWFTTVQEQLRKVGFAPASHPLADENGRYPPELRNTLVGTGTAGSYRAIFTVIDETVYVLRVVRSNQVRVYLPDLS